MTAYQRQKETIGHFLAVDSSLSSGNKTFINSVLTMQMWMMYLLGDK